MKKAKIYLRSMFTLTVISCMSACKSKTLNYVEYYNKVYDIDSIYRINQDPLAAIKQYRRLFRKYPPVQNERIEEYETYIKLADQYGKRFGGRKSLAKLIAQSAPNWKYKEKMPSFLNCTKNMALTA